MGARNPARYLAPLALAATGSATYVIVHDGLKTKPVPTVSVPAPLTTAVTHREFAKAKFYVVRPGDSLSGIAAKTGVPLATLQALNPGVNPRALQPGQRLALRK